MPAGADPVSTDPLRHDGEVRTSLYCHECHKNFIALLEYRLDGNHKAHCPNCGHIHYRVIKDGRVTEDRWNSHYAASGVTPETDDNVIKARRVWKDTTVGIRTYSGPEMIREMFGAKYR